MFERETKNEVVSEGRDSTWFTAQLTRPFVMSPRKNICMSRKWASPSF